jgi:CHASE domain
MGSPTAFFDSCMRCYQATRRTCTGARYYQLDSEPPHLAADARCCLSTCATRGTILTLNISHTTVLHTIGMAQSVEEKKEDSSHHQEPDEDGPIKFAHGRLNPAASPLPTRCESSPLLPAKEASISCVMDNDMSNSIDDDDDDDEDVDDDIIASPGRTNQLLSMMLHNHARRNSSSGGATAAGASTLPPSLNSSEGESSCDPSDELSNGGGKNCSLIHHHHPPTGGGVMPAWMVTLLIVSVGVVASAGFLGMGIRSSYREQYDQFERSADDTVLRFQSAFQIYLSTAAFIHNRCRNRNFSREDFRQLYEYVRASGLAFQAIQFDPRIAREERADAEAEARQYFAQHYPDVPYVGFRGVAHDNTNETFRQVESDFYYPVHYMEPIVGNEGAIGLDYHSSPSRLSTVEDCLRTGKPALTDRLRLIQQEEMVYGVVLMHPGVKLSKHHRISTVQDSIESNSEETWPRDISSIVIRIPDLIGLAMGNQGGDSAAYLFDPTLSDANHTGEPLFLGGVRVSANHSANKTDRRRLTFLPETRLGLVMREHRYHKMVNVSAANKAWTVVVVAVDGTFQPQLVFVLLSSAMILLASAGLAFWNYSYTERVLKFNAIKAAAEADKQALILESARQAAVAERELNDFIAYVHTNKATWTCVISQHSSLSSCFIFPWT